jgi:hypothetical protein
MHFATAFDIVRKTAAQLVGDNMVVHMNLDSGIMIGSQTLTLVSEYDSEDIAAKQRGLLRQQKELAYAAKS